jgi:hypothetical protein
MHRRHKRFGLIHLYSLLVIVDDFHVVAMAIAPDKADAPLIIDTDRVLSFPISRSASNWFPGGEAKTRNSVVTISSRKRLPPSASRNRNLHSLMCPGIRTFSYPKSSDSISVSGIAPHSFG